jgi:hypothetical protein
MLEMSKGLACHLEAAQIAKRQNPESQLGWMEMSGHCLILESDGNFYFQLHPQQKSFCNTKIAKRCQSSKTPHPPPDIPPAESPSPAPELELVVAALAGAVVAALPGSAVVALAGAFS